MSKKEEYDDRIVKDSWMWIRDAKGHGSVTVTILMLSFVVTTLAYILSMFESLGPVSIRQFDVGAASVYFIPILSLYGTRKYTDKKFEVEQKKIEQSSNE